MPTPDASRSPRPPGQGRRVRSGSQAPSGAELTARTVELTALLGSTDPSERDERALPLLLSWIDAGAHDHVLAAVGDGMTEGLRAGLATALPPDLSPGVGLGAATALPEEDTTQQALRRAGSAQILAAVVRRDNDQHLLHPETLLDWAESVFAWIVREPVVQPPDPIGHGADVLAALADSRHFDALALTVLLDVLADRLLAPEAPHGDAVLSSADIDLLARAATHVIVRDLVAPAVLDPWVRRIAAGGRRTRTLRATPARAPGGAPVENARHFLRALHLRIALGPERPQHRADVLLTLTDAIRTSSPALFEA